MKNEEPLHLKYRPASFDEVVGHKIIVGSLKKAIKHNRSHTFLFTGPSGTGKTTLARIVANALGCLPEGILEVDAATHTGIDAMRDVTKTLQYKSIGTDSKKAIIIDEVGSLSKNAWQSLLKVLEEPPKYAYFMLCTTEPSKVPVTIKTRNFSYDLKPISRNDIFDLLVDINEKEDLSVHEDVIYFIADVANGSPRQALVFLGMCAGCQTIKKASKLVQMAHEDKEIIDLCRWLIKGKAITWSKALKYVTPLKDANPESIRIVVVNYIAAALLKTERDANAGRLLEILDCFSEPYNQSDKMAPLLLSIGRLIFEGED